ncbi:hypothetical protein CRX72_23640 [Pantoea sp. BRM17]|nr:hypothetical protein CRX72_23640 [Pantoea sp. BRM17]
MIVEFESRILALIDDMVDHASDDELFASGYQSQFEAVEVKPQALEWLFCVAADFPFNVSCDNLEGDCEPDRIAFQRRVHAQVMHYLEQGIPARPAQFLIKGDDEPIYLPADAESPWHRVVFAHGFYASALHEISHWCIAGDARRQQVDFGYWYCPDGRDAQTPPNCCGTATGLSYWPGLPQDKPTRQIVPPVRQWRQMIN